MFACDGYTIGAFNTRAFEYRWGGGIHQLAEQALSVSAVTARAAGTWGRGRHLEVGRQAAHVPGRVLGRHAQRHIRQAQRMQRLRASTQRRLCVTPFPTHQAAIPLAERQHPSLSNTYVLQMLIFCSQLRCSYISMACSVMRLEKVSPIQCNNQQMTLQDSKDTRALTSR